VKKKPAVEEEAMGVYVERVSRTASGDVTFDVGKIARTYKAG
jgi:hypothetical protein